MTTFRVLGPLEAVRDGRALALGGRKQRAVLAVLLLDAGRVVSTDRIADVLWDEPPPSMLASLHAFVSNLRRTLRDDHLATSPILRQPPGYLIDVPSDAIDLTRFIAACDRADAALGHEDWPAAVEAAQRATALHRGPLLADFADEEWVRVAGVTVDERRSACDQALVTGLLGSGRLAEAVAESGRLVAAHPLTERVCWLRMTALYHAGRSGDALDAYRAFAGRLDAELGLDVGVGLRDLQAAILRQDPALATWPRTDDDVAATVRPAAPAPSTDASEPVAGRGFVGRKRELAAIVRTLGEARSTGTRWTLLTGPRGHR